MAAALSRLDLRWRINLALAGLVLVLGITQTLIQPEEPTYPSLRSALGEPVERIRIQRQSGEITELLQQQGTWKLVDGRPVNSKLIPYLLGLRTMDCARQWERSRLELTRLGLEPPQLRVWWNETQVDFGYTQLDELRYLRSGNTVWLCPDRLPVFDQPSTAFTLP